MEERGDQNEEPVLRCEPELTARNTGKVHRADRVLEPGVAGTGVDKERKPELPDIAQALDRRRIKERQDPCIHFHIAMDRVFDDLRIHAYLIIFIYSA